MRLFYIPLLYTYCTRLKTPMKALSLVIIYVLPVLFMACIAVGGINWHTILVVMLSIVTLYNLYEIGYIQNDAETIKKEQKPNLRLTSCQLNHYEKFKVYIYAIRLMLEMVMISVLYWLTDPQSCMQYSISLLIMMVIFYLYNHFRSHIIMLLYLLLLTARYFTPLTLFIEGVDWQLLLTVVLVFPLVKTIEFKSDKGPDTTTNIWFRKYILKYDIQRLTAARVVEYTVILGMVLVLYSVGIFTTWYYILPILWMWGYRSAIYVSLLLGAKYKLYLKN